MSKKKDLPAPLVTQCQMPLRIATEPSNQEELEQELADRLKELSENHLAPERLK